MSGGTISCVNCGTSYRTSTGLHSVLHAVGHVVGHVGADVAGIHSPRAALAAGKAGGDVGGKIADAIVGPILCPGCKLTQEGARQAAEARYLREQQARMSYGSVAATDRSEAWGCLFAIVLVLALGFGIWKWAHWVLTPSPRVDTVPASVPVRTRATVIGTEARLSAAGSTSTSRESFALPDRSTAASPPVAHRSARDSGRRSPHGQDVSGRPSPTIAADALANNPDLGDLGLSSDRPARAASRAELPDLPLRSELLAALRPQLVAARRCVDGFVGSIPLTLVVSGSGRPTIVEVHDDRLNHSATSCIAAALRRTTFPRFRETSESLSVPLVVSADPPP